MLRRQHRLRKRRAFRRLFEEGRSWAEPAAVLHTLPQPAPEKRIAVSASRKLGGAVQRNRMRRRFAALCRQFEPWVRHGVHMVFVPRAAAAALEPRELAAAIERLLRRAGAWSDAPADGGEP